jgi:acetylglutamate kinase
VLNDLIVEEINAHGELARPFKPEDKLLKAVKKNASEDLGFVGELVGFDRELLNQALEKTIPVISPLGVSEEGVVYNINADDVAFYLASELKAEKLVLLTKVLGVMRDPEDEASLISTITAEEAESLIKDKVISAGMVPKVRAAVNTINAGARKAHIIDAKIPHGILLEIFTDKGIGTEIIKEG